jgi:hypothetical protein
MLQGITRNSACLLIVFAVLLSVRAASAQTSQFTYQGKLTDGGNPSNGNFDFEFKLFNAVSGGSQQGSTLQRPNVTVTNGIFTVLLDFTASFFPGADRFLEISVAAAGSGSFTVLNPRQQIGSTPYAIKSAGAASADSLSAACTGCVTDTQINAISGSKISGAIPVASVPAGSGSYIQNTTSPQTSSNFNISGNGTVGGSLTVTGTLSASGASLTNLNAGNISSGTVAVARGGTGLGAAGASGNYLRSNGVNWASAAIQTADIPSGSTNYIQNTTSPQSSSNFNITGDGVIAGDLTVAGTLTANLPMRKYYMTSATPAGNAVLTACIAGYHTASLAEIFNTSVLQYATDLGVGVAHTLPDSGSGPPFSSLAFIRVGVTGSNNAVAGNANCISGGNPWSTNSAAVNGTAIALKPTWNDAPTNVSPWDATVRPCSNNVAPVAHVWCVQN